MYTYVSNKSIKFAKIIQTTMRKLILTFMICLVGLSSWGQNLFSLTKEGTYVAQDGQPYVIIEIPNEDAHSIYQSILANAQVLLVNPTDKLYSTPDYQVSFNVRMFTSGTNSWPGGYYDGLVSYVFRIKDGKVQVWPPSIQGEYAERGLSKDDYVRHVQTMFEKIDDPKEKNPDKWSNYKQGTEDYINNVINYILYGWSQYDW
ncbi:MAG: hypothetical protein LIP09_16645 [Bacteroidales bacterium]|nr:hypothetical protein [Bacteroidales bacterium]